MKIVLYLLFIIFIFNNSYSNEKYRKYEKFINKKNLVNHFTIKEIENIKIPKDWALVKDIKFYDAVIKEYYTRMPSPKIVSELQINNGDQVCFEHLKKFDSINYETETKFWKTGTTLDWDSCIMYAKFRQFKGNVLNKSTLRNTDLLKNYLLYYSSTDSFILQQDSVHYSYYSILSMLAKMYAIEKPNLGFTKDEIVMVENWFVKRASVGFADSKYSYNRGNCKFPLKYDKKGIKKTAKLYAKGDATPLYEGKTKYRGGDECGSLGTRHAFTRLLIGLVANDQSLFDKGIIDLKYFLSFIDSNGVFMPYAARGGAAISYSSDFLYFISVFAEIFHSLGINFYEIVIPSGIKIKDAIDFHYTIWGDEVPEELIRYSKLNFGNKNHDWTELLKPIQERKGSHNGSGKMGIYLPGTKETFIRLSTRYAQKYRKDIFKNINEWGVRYEGPIFGANRALNLHAIVRANERYEANIINIQKEKEILAQKEKERVKDLAQKEKERVKDYENLLSSLNLKKENNLYLLPSTNLKFNKTQNPIINVKREFEIVSVRIRGDININKKSLTKINPDLSHVLKHFDQLDLKIALLEDRDVKAVGYFLIDPPFEDFMHSINKEIFNKCGRLLKNENWLVIVTEVDVNNKEVTKHQKCIKNSYSEQEVTVALLYKIFLKSAPSIWNYLED